MDLISKKCVPCEGGMPSLTHAEIGEYMPQVKEWQCEDDKKIFREFKFKNFKEAMEFVNKVAGIAEEEGHHPDLFIHSWNKVRITLWTHAIDGLSENDFILAAKINKLIE